MATISHEGRRPAAIRINFADGEHSVPDWVVAKLGPAYFHSPDNISLLTDCTLAEFTSSVLQMCSEDDLRERCKEAIQNALGWRRLLNW